MTPALFTTPYWCRDAAIEFAHLLRTGNLSRYGTVNKELIPKKRYYKSTAREEIEHAIIGQLNEENDCRPILCIVAEGAPTAVEAFALRLGRLLPRSLNNPKAPRRDILLVPCGQWVAPSGFRGMKALVHHVARMLRGAPATERIPEMSEKDLQREIRWLREEFGKRPVILVFVGHDALSGPLARLQEAIVDAPLTSLLAHLSRPAIGTAKNPFDPQHFPWTYFVVIGTAEINGLEEYKQVTLDLPAIEVRDFPKVLKPSTFHHGGEMLHTILERTVPASEAETRMFEQIRRIETIRAAAGDKLRASDFGSLTEVPGLDKLSGRLFERLSDPGRPIGLALTLLSAFAIGGIRRATLLRCLLLWGDVFPQRPLEPWPGTTGEWSRVFDEWLACFSPILRSGPNERWGEIDPRQHPFEYTGDERRSGKDRLHPFAYTGDLLSGPAGDGEVWLDQSIHFLIADVRYALVACVEGADPALARGLHFILAEEALRQHTMMLRHTSPADRLTVRSHRRGLQALFHGLGSLPPRFSEDSRDTVIGPSPDRALSLPSLPMRRFTYLYGGLFPSLLRDDVIGNIGAAWGAERIKLEIASFADDLLFPRARAGTLAPGGRRVARKDIYKVPAAMHRAHYCQLASAAVRAGPHAGWADARVRIGKFMENEDSPGGGNRLLDNVLLQMDVTQYGPDDPRTRTLFKALAKGLDVALGDFEDPEWALPGRQAADFPTVDDLCELVETKLVVMGSVEGEAKSDIGSLLFVFGIMRADSAEARLKVNRSSTTAQRKSLSLLLKAFAAMLVASQLMWDGYGEEDCPLPYFAAEGLRNLSRVGLEIMRQLRKWQQDDSGGADALPGLAWAVTARVRRSLDQYARVFHTSESDRTHMLILESRFARLAYHAGPAGGGAQGGERIRSLVDPRRYELALAFLNEAEASLLTFFATDSLRIRLLSERCSLLRYLAATLMQGAKADPVPVQRSGRLKRAGMAVRLGMLDVRQCKNIIERLADAEAVWLTLGRKAKWSDTADYHEAELRKLASELATM